MAILENIRKRTTILILIIGLALFAFVISGVFTSSDFGSVGKVGSTVAEVNGEEISVDAFRQKMEFASQNSANTSSLQLVNQVYDQEVRNAILGQQFEGLGIDIEQDQIMNYIKTIPGYAQSPQFQDESGIFDENKFRDFVEDMKAAREDGRYARWLQTEKSIIQSAKEQAYFNLIKAGVGATLKEGELDYKLANSKVDLKYVRVPYASIPDSIVTVTKSEIAAYINAHKDEYKQEESRDLQFIYFEEKASAEDEAVVKEEISKLMFDQPLLDETTKEIDTVLGFENTKNVADFLDGNSDIKFDTIYKAKKALPALFADSLMALNVGETYGPYRDGDFFKISKMIARKANGSVKASHILVTYEGAQRANPDVKRTKEEAETRAKQLLRDARKPGAAFVELARDNSDGPSAPNGGDLGFFQEGVMTPKFNDYAFGNKVGSIGLVETDFGFHIVRVDDKEDIVQIGHLAREIEASEETINNLFTEATKFEMATISGDKVFTDLAKESEYLVRPVNKITALDENLPGLTNQRSIVQWAFNEDTKIGDIKRFNINNGYAVVQLTKEYKEGVMSVEDASASILPKVRKERKAAQIIGQHQGKSMEDLAKDANVSASNATALTVKSPTIPGAGREAAIVGAAYAMNEGETSGLIEGETGVFMVTVTKKDEAAALDNYSTYANTLKTSSAGKVNMSVFNALKEASEIEDNRAVFY